MKTPIAIALMALVSLTATDASAYKLSPPDASVHLHGRMTFTPNEGGTPFTCSVTLDLKTKRGEIIAVKFPKGVSDCEGVNFQGMPWYIDILTSHSGQFSFRGFGSNNGNCVADAIKFKINKSDKWTFLSGQCLSGILTSNPPTTIVK